MAWRQWFTYKPINVRSRTIQLALGSEIVSIAIGIVVVALSAVPLSSKIIWVASIVIVGCILAKYTLKQHYCYLACSRRSLESNAEQVHLWLVFTGIVPEGTFFVSPWGSTSGPRDEHHEAYWSILKKYGEENAQGGWSEKPKTHVVVGNRLRPGDYCIEFLTAENGWKERLTIVEDRKALKQNPIEIIPDSEGPFPVTPPPGCD